ncbi:penicillin-binding protein [Prevotella pallens]|jgi:penicillin-binding protein, transpeptidase domain protein|uniref:Cell division protein FtsI (Penicillin-binding protein 3) n=2 Tax=Prevotella pallens TaxID=60133 RepID=A0A379F3B7_9BACT|nr:penicillin-binding protein [Prevotella pallens]EGQ21310.1 penicillin-binding protein [Prevotella pallens ATCC 700821]MBF1442691.1 transpeptidase family protein [Prevotella pallens]MBF1451694.1 transpeptidase family protein [Prevotella pallens]MBF1459421.1 transpeptidase family protein [Prevotella pallens]MBF1460240.1 transpeptidase family protein [Prevotella pallens]
MSKFNSKNIMPRYSLIALVMSLIAIAVVAKSAYIMIVQKNYWLEVAAKQKKDNVPILPTRGNILSSDGELMASSLPEFKIYIDFKTLKEAGKDTAFVDSINYICKGLNELFPEKTAGEFKQELLEGLKEEKRHCPIWKNRIDYNTYKEVKKLPVFKYDKFKSGFHEEEFNARRRPFGSLAQRTVGDLYGSKDVARCGLELSFDSILRGTNGVENRRKIRNKYLSITETPPIDGSDIVTTIDVGIQDLAERALLNELQEINGNVGVAIVMEVATGDIKAIVNLDKCEDGQYREIKNHAVSDLLEPGSVFKTASMMVALDDNVVDTMYTVETGGGVWTMYGRDMKDHNWRRGGYGTLTLPWCLKYSSNIGVSRIIDTFYHKNPEKFVQGIYKLGLADDLQIPITGYSPAKIRMPKKNKHGQYINWSNTALPWMSIGYESQVPPISTLTFYNAIANGGKMMRPRFVKKVVKDGTVLAEYPPVVQREQIAKESTITEMRRILTEVVSEGLGKKAGSDKFSVAGKTGTAQMSKGVAGYKTGVTDYLLSFAGFFPADAPRYSCIVCIQKSGLPASGGGMSGVVFHNIAEGIMAQNLKLSVSDARDSSASLIPMVKSGNLLATDYVLSFLGFNVKNGWNGAYPFGNNIWGFAKTGSNGIILSEEKNINKRYVPDVHNMGARDAIYLLENCGIKVIMSGRGRVVEQSLAPGEKIKQGMVCKLRFA